MNEQAQAARHAKSAREYLADAVAEEIAGLQEQVNNPAHADEALRIAALEALGQLKLAVAVASIRVEANLRRAAAVDMPEQLQRAVQSARRKLAGDPSVVPGGGEEAP